MQALAAGFDTAAASAQSFGPAITEHDPWSSI
jgi:hypothetical protein